VGRVVAKLEALGLRDNTLVIFSSDNGGVGGYASVGLTGKDGITNNAPLKGGKGTLYEGGVRVPYIFNWPGKIKSGTTNDRPINSVDLYPTLLEIASADKPRQPLDGVSYLKSLRGETLADRGPLFWHFPGYLGFANDQWRTTPGGSIHDGDWKLIEYFEDGHLELYNLASDIGETKNLADAEPERAKKMHDAMLAWREAVGAKMPTKNDPTTAKPAPKKKGGGKGKGKRKGK
jgi:arylsulfatase A-like enzyme